MNEETLPEDNIQPSVNETLFNSEDGLSVEAELTSPEPTPVQEEAVQDDATPVSVTNMPWDLDTVESQMSAAYEADSETDLLKVLKDNSFLFYDLYDRKYGIQPVFREINFGTEFRCDFAWLNDNSSGPEWVLVELESPKMPLFTKQNKPTAKLQGALEQVKMWDRYFDENKGEAKRMFGAVAKFRFILVAGSSEDWSAELAQKWRIYNHKRFHIEIRSMATFLKSLAIAKTKPDEMWSFAEHPVTLPHGQLEKFWSEYDYMDQWRKIID